MVSILVMLELALKAKLISPQRPISRVSILVMLELALKDNKFKYLCCYLIGFNPCDAGTCSKRSKQLSIIVNYLKVSILVMLELALKGKIL
ncbi:MAG: hypothetical protein RLZZ628_1565 [Bacteroidota bacterium]